MATTKKTAKTTKSAKAPAKTVAKKTTAKASECCAEHLAPLGTAGFIGYQFLFNIPVVGWILCFAYAVMLPNANLRSFARAQLFWLLVTIAAVITLTVTGSFHDMAVAFGWV